jgi:hypothetical protein
VHKCDVEELVNLHGFHEKHHNDKKSQVVLILFCEENDQVDERNQNRWNRDNVKPFHLREILLNKEYCD